MSDDARGPVPDHFFNQSGVVPYRLVNGTVEVLLITTVKRKRWTIPKGVKELEMSAVESAQKECEEEAGVRGRPHPKPIGRYEQRKWGGVCTIEVYLLEVTEWLDDYDEARSRDRRWFAAHDAPAQVKKSGLREILLAVPVLLDERGLA